MRKKINGIISLDVASVSTGWCYSVRSKIKNYGKIVIKSNKFSVPERLSILRKELSKILCKYNPNHVVIENGFAGKNITTLKVLSNFSGVAKECSVTQLDIVPYIMNNKRVKAYFGVNTKKELYDYMVSTYFIGKQMSFEEYNDITDACAQAICYYNIVIMGENKNEQIF